MSQYIDLYSLCSLGFTRGICVFCGVENLGQYLWIWCYRMGMLTTGVKQARVLWFRMANSPWWSLLCCISESPFKSKFELTIYSQFLLEIDCLKIMKNTIVSYKNCAVLCCFEFSQRPQNLSTPRSEAG